MLVGVLGQLVLSLKTIVVKTTRTILMSSKHAYVMISRLGCSHLGYLGEEEFWNQLRSVAPEETD